eukprot:5862443-Prymnesium_polylepis.3
MPVSPCSIRLGRSSSDCCSVLSQPTDRVSSFATLQSLLAQRPSTGRPSGRSVRGRSFRNTMRVSAQRQRAPLLPGDRVCSSLPSVLESARHNGLVTVPTLTCTPPSLCLCSRVLKRPRGLMRVVGERRTRGGALCPCKVAARAEADGAAEDRVGGERGCAAHAHGRGEHAYASQRHTDRGACTSDGRRGRCRNLAVRTLDETDWRSNCRAGLPSRMLDRSRCMRCRHWRRLPTPSLSQRWNLEKRRSRPSSRTRRSGGTGRMRRQGVARVLAQLAASGTCQV